MSSVSVEAVKMNKIKIGYYTSAEDCGGADVYLRDLIENIDREKYTVVLFCRHNYPALEKIFTQPFLFILEPIDQPQMPPATTQNQASPTEISPENSFRTLLQTIWRKLPFNYLKLFVGVLKETLFLMNLFKKHKIEILHCNDAGSEAAAFAARILKIPVVIMTYHWLATHEGDWLRRKIENLSMRCLDMFIAVSESTKKAWIERTGIKPDHVRVIYNGIDIKKFSVTSPLDSSLFKSKLEFKDSDIIIGLTARLTPVKGHQYLIEAAPQIIKEVPNAHFVFTGDGVAREELKEMAKRLGVDEHIKFLGFRKNVAEITAVYDIAVLPSVALESFGLVLAEAMALGKPVVATNFSGIPEVVTDGVHGFLVPRYDAKALAEAILRLLTNKELTNQMGQAAQKRVHEHFTLERMLRQTFQLYEELCDEQKN